MESVCRDEFSGFLLGDFLTEVSQKIHNFESFESFHSNVLACMPII